MLRSCSPLQNCLPTDECVVFMFFLFSRLYTFMNSLTETDPFDHIVVLLAHVDHVQLMARDVNEAREE